MVRLISLVVGTLAAAMTGSAVLGVAWLGSREVDAPYPPLSADTSPEGVARGEAIFHAMCGSCHRATGSDRANGARMEDVPSFLGEFWSANLTRHETAGIGALTDAEIARALRYGVTHDGRKSIMGFRMGDADIEAVLGFVRSDDPVFEADPTVRPRTKLSLVGKALLVATGALSVPDLPASGIPVPPKEDRLAYGRYMVHDVYDCAGCHSPGYSSDKGQGPRAFTGGFEFADQGGRKVISPNITLDASGIGGWTEADLARALRDGLRPDGRPLSYPMPRFRGADDAEVAAIYEYLRSVGPREAHKNVAKREIAAPVTSLAAVEDGPEALFQARGCAGCHAEGAPYRDNLVKARGKDPEALAAWIRNPQDFRPGTPMPTYASVLSEDEARSLADWIRAGAR